MIQCYKKDDKFFLVDGEKVLSITKKLAIAFSQDDEFWVLHKIGAPKDVEVYYQNYKKGLRSRGLLGQLGNFIYLELPENLSTDEVNLLLEDRSYLETLVESIGKGHVTRRSTENP